MGWGLGGGRVRQTSPGDDGDDAVASLCASSMGICVL